MTLRTRTGRIGLLASAVSALVLLVGCGGDNASVGAELPITDGVCAVLGGVTLNELVSSLMQRAPTEE